MIPCTDVQAVEFVMAGVTAEDLYAQRIRQHWLMKIQNASSHDLERYIWDLGPREAQSCRIVYRFEKFRESIQSKDLDLSKLERLVTELKVRAQERVGSSDGADDYVAGAKIASTDSGVLELLRITILLAIIRQLQRQMAGLI